MNQEEARKLAENILNASSLGAKISVPSNGFVQFVPANPANGQYDAVLVELIMEIPLNG